MINSEHTLSTFRRLAFLVNQGQRELESEPTYFYSSWSISYKVAFPVGAVVFIAALFLCILKRRHFLRQKLAAEEARRLKEEAKLNSNLENNFKLPLVSDPEVNLSRLMSKRSFKKAKSMKSQNEPRPITFYDELELDFKNVYENLENFEATKSTIRPIAKSIMSYEEVSFSKPAVRSYQSKEIGASNLHRNSDSGIISTDNISSSPSSTTAEMKTKKDFMFGTGSLLQESAFQVHQPQQNRQEKRGSIKLAVGMKERQQQHTDDLLSNRADRLS